ncbi:hypothetical protein RSOLAG1IB_11271 [Rhizoctonia solani AG-1 IB]|uniref:Uncharacterized protein n=1 Tax=Thanatephorus cucumeris (strain AG1-IB / isolate 7/3/14) TaxID=1108050 RepID=A0A0B7F8D7_THACB|nr:hypothetical protein RSOLAG1IB_11271 [Rhizoctonia solani AG-1 IB]
MARAYLSVFTKPKNQKQITKSGEVTHAHPKHGRIAGNPVDIVSTGETKAINAGSDSGSKGEEGLVDNINKAKAKYDSTTVKASVNLAFMEVEKAHGILISPSNRQSAQQLLPKVHQLLLSLLSLN